MVPRLGAGSTLPFGFIRADAAGCTGAAGPAPAGCGRAARNAYANPAALDLDFAQARLFEKLGHLPHDVGIDARRRLALEVLCQPGAKRFSLVAHCSVALPAPISPAIASMAKHIAHAAEPHDHALGSHADIGMPAKRLPLIRVGEVDLDDRLVQHLQGVEEGNRRVGVSPGVDDHAGTLGPGLLDPVDELAFVVRLPEHDLQPGLFRPLADRFLDVGKRLPAVDFRLAAAKKVEIRPVKDIYGKDHA